MNSSRSLDAIAKSVRKRACASTPPALTAATIAGSWLTDAADFGALATQRFVMFGHDLQLHNFAVTHE